MNITKSRDVNRLEIEFLHRELELCSAILFNTKQVSHPDSLSTKPISLPRVIWSQGNFSYFHIDCEISFYGVICLEKCKSLSGRGLYECDRDFPPLSSRRKKEVYSCLFFISTKTFMRLELGTGKEKAKKVLARSFPRVTITSLFVCVQSRGS